MGGGQETVHVGVRREIMVAVSCVEGGNKKVGCFALRGWQDRTG
jgi:hypothetical protein